MRPRVLRNNFETGYLGCFFFSSPHSHSLMKLPQDTALLPRTVYRFCATEFFSAVSIFPNILIKRNWGPGRSNQLVANVRLKAHLLSQAQPLCIPMLPARALNPSLVGGRGGEDTRSSQQPKTSGVGDHQYFTSSSKPQSFPWWVCHEKATMNPLPSELSSPPSVGTIMLMKDNQDSVKFHQFLFNWPGSKRFRMVQHLQCFSFFPYLPQGRCIIQKSRNVQNTELFSPGRYHFCIPLMC